MRRVELGEEHPDAFVFVDLADDGRHPTETDETSEESAVGLVGPPHVSGTTPPVSTERVEAAVITDAISGIPLDWIGSDITQRTPRQQGTRCMLHRSSSQTTRLVAGGRTSLLHHVPNGGILRRQHRTRRALRSEGDGVLIAHEVTLRPRVVAMSAFSVDSAKNVAIVVVVVFLAFTVLSAWVVKNIVGKIISVVILAGLSATAWSQHSSLQTCADKAKAAVAAQGTDASVSCKLFGVSVKVP